jgi:hypothetical protein
LAGEGEQEVAGGFGEFLALRRVRDEVAGRFLDVEGNTRELAGDEVGGLGGPRQGAVVDRGDRDVAETTSEQD